jgi:alternate signal-mediated exported protein
MKKKKKTSKQKRVLTTSIILAMLIVAGGTFAWFTSKDEVTNKLSASNDYNVTVGESFTPPSQWTPGQTVEKKVQVLNTGNTDAFVKLELKNVIDVTVDDTAIDLTDFSENDTAKYVALSEDEAISIQAGGTLVYSPKNTNGTEIAIESGTLYVLPKSNGDSDNYDDGLYIFRRQISEKTTTIDNTETVEYTYKYAGYYKYGDTYYAVDTTSVKDTTSLTSAKIKTVKKLSNQELVFNYSNAVYDAKKENVTDKTYYVKATYKGTNADSTDDDIVINIYLDPTELANWTLLKGNNQDDPYIFYYKNVLKAEGTDKTAGKTGNLITSVELDNSVKSEAYKDFDYYLTVSVDSAQVTADDLYVTAVNAQDWAATASIEAANKDSDGNWNETVTWAIPSATSTNENQSDASSQSASTEDN